MTCADKAKTIIIGSFVLYMIDNLLEVKDRYKGSVIKLRQMIAAKTISPDHIELAEISNMVWSDAIEKHKDNGDRLVVGDALEFLVFGEQSFATVYGQTIFNAIATVSVKVTDEGISKDIMDESREICKTLVSLTKKYSFEYCKGK